MRTLVLTIAVSLGLLVSAQAQAQKGKKATKPPAVAQEAGEKASALEELLAPAPATSIDDLDSRNPLDQAQVLRFFRQARARERALARQQAEATRRIERMKKMRADLEARYAALRVVQSELADRLEAEKKRRAEADERKAEEDARRSKPPEGPEREANIERLSAVFNKMKPAKAGKVVARMDKPLVVEVLMRLKDRQAAKILAEVEPSTAAKLSQLMAKRKAEEGKR